jgi:predicted N-formylglutamate amidohydrolase
MSMTRRHAAVRQRPRLFRLRADANEGAERRIDAMAEHSERLILTCEHAGNVVPERYRPLFGGRVQHLLPTHRGWDPGALLLAHEMAERFAAPLYFEETTRLLVDLNRSVGNPELHSEASRHLTLRERREILDVYYHPHRQRVDAAIAEAVRAGHRVVHVASHSFTPELNGQVRTADIGMLYDPGRPGEVAFATAWLEALKKADPALRLRRNYPYLGKSDGVTMALRRQHPPERYVGVELEVNQRYVEAGGPAWTKIRRTLVETLATALQLRGTGPDGG